LGDENFTEDEMVDDKMDGVSELDAGRATHCC
jgi:hypothetical protein